MMSLFKRKDQPYHYRVDRLTCTTICSCRANGYCYRDHELKVKMTDKLYFMEAIDHNSATEHCTFRKNYSDQI